MWLSHCAYRHILPGHMKGRGTTRGFCDYQPIFRNKLFNVQCAIIIHISWNNDCAIRRLYVAMTTLITRQLWSIGGCLTFWPHYLYRRALDVERRRPSIIRCRVLRPVQRPELHLKCPLSAVWSVDRSWLRPCISIRNCDLAVRSRQASVCWHFIAIKDSRLVRTLPAIAGFLRAPVRRSCHPPGDHPASSDDEDFCTHVHRVRTSTYACTHPTYTIST